MVRVPMPPSRRAKIFSMFDALKGLKEALAAQERIPEPRRYLAEDAIEELNRKLTSLKKGQIATVVYYCEYAQEYHQLTGPLIQIILLHHGHMAQGGHSVVPKPLGSAVGDPPEICDWLVIPQLLPVRLFIQYSDGIRCLLGDDVQGNFR